MGRATAGGPIRIVYLDHVARMSGGEIALLRLLTALRDQVEAHVILAEDGPLVTALRDTGATVEVLPMAPTLRDVRRDQVAGSRLAQLRLLALARHVLALRRRLRELEPALVHTNSLKAALYGGLAGRLAGVPVVWHLRDRIAADYLPSSAVRLVRLAGHLLPAVIVANSHATLATIPRGRRGAGYDDVAIPDIGPDVAPPRVRAGGPFRVGMLGRLTEWKGQRVFLHAFAEAFPDGDEQGWITGSAMFGEEGYEASLQALAASLGIADRITWRGFRDDVTGELAQLDALVHCSTTPEPFGQVVVEGMAAGLPVVAAAAGGPLEIIDDGHDGLLTPPGDVAALAEALRALAKDPPWREQLGAAARESSRRFSPSAASSRVIAVYHRLLGVDGASSTAG